MSEGQAPNIYVGVSDSADHSAAKNAPLFLAGHTAPAGTYRQVETGQEVRLDQDGPLPAAFDGHIAVYKRRPPTWADLYQEDAV